MAPDAMKNYRDLSDLKGAEAALQFEFFCNCCQYTWKSPIQKYRTGRLMDFMGRVADLTSIFGTSNVRGMASSATSEIGFAAGGAREKKIRQEALAKAKSQAARYFNACESCADLCCENCIVGADGWCTRCEKNAMQGQPSAHGGGSVGMTAAVCPNCQIPSEGGRFCHECGFDMASTHKACPGCGGVMPKASRFCTDCGHGF